MHQFGPRKKKMILFSAPRIAFVFGQVLKTLIGFASLYASGHLSELKKWNLRESARLVALPGFIYAVGKPVNLNL